VLVIAAVWLHRQMCSFFSFHCRIHIEHFDPMGLALGEDGKLGLSHQQDGWFMKNKK
jgi:hypothetical protein